MNFARNSSPRMANGERLVDRSARMALAPLANRIADWKARAARLHAESFLLHARHLPIDALALQAQEFASEVAEEMESARHRLEAFSDNSRYLDMELSYRQLMQSLQRLVDVRADLRPASGQGH